MKRMIWASMALAAFAAQAHEGMWMPQQLPLVAKDMKAAGLKIDPARLSQPLGYPMGAVVSLGGCTASFVSPQGLVVTNHHCAFGSIQYNSTPQKDLLKNGFLAASLADELPAAPGSRILVTVALTDVTDKIIDKKTAALQGKARFDAMEANQKAQIAACEKDSGHRCSIGSYYGGLMFQLVKQLEIRDVRLVHAPAEGVGLFGGDTDNWVWPRHTGDYSFYRAYVGPDGKPADFSPNNKPFVPPHVLKLASSPLNEGDFVAVAGYPGRTNRHRLPQEVDFAFSWDLPTRVKTMGEQLATIKEATAGRRDAEIKLANTVAGVNNYFKNYQGQIASYTGSDILARKQAGYAAMKAWVEADAKRRALYGPSLAEAERVIAERQVNTRREFLLSYATPTLLKSASDLYEQALERRKPDAERKAGFQDRDQLRRKQSLETVDRRFDEATEKKLVSHFLTQYLAQPADQLNAAFLKALGVSAGMDAAAVTARVDGLYAGTKLTDKAERSAWLTRDAADFEASADTLVKAAVLLHADEQARENRDKELAGRLQQAYATVMQAEIDFKASRGQAVYPDANSTLRVAFGQVKGRNPGVDGTTWTAFTTLRGIVAKNTGSGEFNAPAEQLAAIKARNFDKYGVKALDSVPVNFLATLDTTGGNSGSPVLNGKGELVGLLFDGTLDAVISDWDFNDNMNRSICLDARYMLWQMKVVDKADRLLKEMNAL
ncbi:S46 family peptidase [Roseateles sp.]|uniref:S46 family peptidase n=1 Tax=Roseateles sp. TaxID=1971397 RepID=UPI0031E3EB8A